MSRNVIARALPLIFLLVAVMNCISCGGGGSSSGFSGSSGGGTTGGGTGGGGGSTPQAPVLTRISPSRVYVGVPQGIIIIKGANFTSASKVLLDGVAATASLDDSSDLELYIDTSLFYIPKTHTIQVTDSGAASNTLTYDVYVPQPGALSMSGEPTQPLTGTVAGNGTLVDVNGDGRSDLITLGNISQGGSTVLTICFGQADGTFSPPVPANATTTTTPTQVLAGDFNGDGHNDLILVSARSYQALINDGTGRFTAAGSGALPGGNWGRGAVGDFNGDGKLDFVIDTGQVPSLSLLFGNGDGTFGAPAPLGANAPNKAARVVAADLNGDGVTDLVYADYTLSPAAPDDSLEIHTLIFQRDGSSTDAIVSPPAGPSWSFAVGDFNNDGIQDLFLIDANLLNGQVLAGDGHGGFAAAGSAVPAADGFLVTPPFVTGDFDGDGNLDIATRLTEVGPDVTLFLWGDGRGNFTSQIIASDQSFYMTTGDVNGDGVPDILETGSFGYSGVILARHDRNFPSAKLLLNAPRGALSAGNVFNDGSQGILVSGSGDCSTNVGTSGAIYEFQPNGAPSLKGSTPTCASVLGDLDGDGIAELVGSYQNTIIIWKGDGTGIFQAPAAEITIPEATAIENLVFRDMDGDGHIDIVTPGAILYGKGNLQFDQVGVPAIGSSFLIGDFDGDSKPDILVTGGVLFNQGNRSFTAPTGPAPACWSVGYLRIPAAGDLDGDGKDDLVCGTDEPPLLEIYISAGRAGFVQDQVVSAIGFDTIVETVNIGDFNGDGRNDIAAGTLSPDDVVLFLNDGKGGYQMSAYAVGVNPVLSIVGDFNHDGKADLGFLNYGYDYKPPAIEVLLQK